MVTVRIWPNRMVAMAPDKGAGKFYRGERANEPGVFVATFGATKRL